MRSISDERIIHSFAGKSVLVTGGGGFLGSHLVRRLLSLGSSVTCLGGNRESVIVCEGAHYVFGDISLDTLNTVAFVPNAIFHLAGGASVSVSLADPPRDFLRTVYSTVLLLDFARIHWPKSPVVYTSSAAVYGEAGHQRADHGVICRPISPYGVHKRHVELLLLDHARIYGTRSVILRPFSVYGPGLRKQLLWEAMEKARNGVYEFFGSGQELRDWVYVTDVVECLLRSSMLSSTRVPVYNVGTGRAISVRTVLTELYHIAGIEHHPIFIGAHKGGDPNRLVAEGSIEQTLGGLLSTSLSEGLRTYVDWYRLAWNDPRRA